MKIELFTDPVCPFCYIGKTNLDRAIEKFTHRDRTVIIHRGFQLDPSATKAGDETLPEREMRVHGLSREAADARLGMVTDLASRAGLAYRLDRALPVNSYDAHRLRHFAATRARADELMELMLRGYAIEGRSLADHPTLIELAVAAGLEASDAARVLGSTDFATEVAADRERARQLGVFAVPTAVVDERWQLPLVESADLVLDGLERVA